jgi:hypothetical protein
MTMTSRERVLAALRHEHPDRTPRDFWAEPPALNRLFAHVGHNDKDRLLDALGVDLRHLEAPAPPERELGDGLFQNFWGERYVYNQTPWGPMREDAKGALVGATSFAELETFPWPAPDCLDRSQLQAQCARYENHALLYGFADVWQRPALVRGWEGMFFDMIDRIHHLGGRVLYHSCGLIRPFIPELIALGVDILDPIQPVSDAMQPENLKHDFGNRLCFHGGIDMQHLLPSATPVEVKAEVRRYCEILGRNGGYILGPAHLFQPDVPPENVLAVYCDAL